MDLRAEQAAFRQAADLHARGERGEAARACDAILSRAPGFAPAMHLRGFIALEAGDLARAGALLEGARRITPAEPTIHQSLGLLFRAARRHPEAVAAFREALRLDRRLVTAWNSLGLSLLDLGRPAEALQALGSGLEISPGHPETLHNLGLVLERLGRLEEAEARYRAAAAARPGQLASLFALGRTLLERQKPAEAEPFLARALSARADWADARAALALALEALGRDSEAERVLRAAPEATQAGIAVNLANLLARQGRAAEALPILEAAVARSPGDPAARHNRANVLASLGRIDEAMAGYRDAIGLAPAFPDPHFGLSRWLLARGELAQGWEENAWRPPNLPSWLPREGLSRSADPAAVERALRERSLEIVEEQGLGDVVFYLRWAPWFASQGWRVTLRVSPRLAPLLARAGSWTMRPDLAAPLGVDCAAMPVGDLPQLAVRLGGPAKADSLRIEPRPDRLEAARQALAEAGPAPYTALTWRAGVGRRFVGRDMLSKEAEALALWRHVDAGGTLVAMQRGLREGELDLLRPHARAVADFAGWTEDLESLLGLLAAIDGYAGVSNTNMHLLAALGRHATVVVPHPPEWRWAGEDGSPWFPGFKVVRQGPGEPWPHALDRVLGAPGA